MSRYSEKKTEFPSEYTNGEYHEAVFTVTEFSDGESAIAKFTKNGKTHKIYLNIEDSTPLQAGDVISANVVFTQPDTVKAAGFYSYLAGRGIHIIGYADRVKVTGLCEDGLDGFIFRIRRYTASVGSQRLSGEEQALFSSMILGDKHLMTDELTQKLQSAGLSHVAAVSGMHLSVVLAAMAIIIEKAFGKRRRGSVVSIVGVVFLTLLTGAGASVVRAAVMCIIYLSAKIFRREADSYTTLSLTVLLMTAANPYVIFNAGFVLSVLAVLGIFLFNQKISNILKGVLSGFFRDALSVTISAQLTTALAVVYYFGIFTPYSVISNLFAALFANLTIIAGMMLILFNRIPLLGIVLTFVEKYSARAVIEICDIVENLPFAMIEIKEKELFSIAWLFVLSLFFVKKQRLAVLKLTAVFLIAFMTVMNVKTVRKNYISIHCACVDTFEMSALFLPDGEAMLIDCPSSTGALNFLEEHGREKYDYVLFTMRNKGKLQNLINKGVVETVLVPETVFDTPGGTIILENAAENGVKVITLNDNEVFFCANATVSFSPLHVARNEKAAVKINYKDKSFLFMQAYNHGETAELMRLDMHPDGDYIRLSVNDYHNAYEFNGKILNNKKEFTVNLY